MSTSVFILSDTRPDRSAPYLSLPEPRVQQFQRGEPVHVTFDDDNKLWNEKILRGIVVHAHAVDGGSVRYDVVLDDHKYAASSNLMYKNGRLIGNKLMKKASLGGNRSSDCAYLTL